jgi:predicted DNA-binding transcriptional regulator AlpA
MVVSWRYRSVVHYLEQGLNFREAAQLGGVSRQAIWKRMNANPEFAQAVTTAREKGRKEREFRTWLRHPFRGRRPPTGKGHGGKPRFRYGSGAR